MKKLLGLSIIIIGLIVSLYSEGKKLDLVKPDDYYQAFLKTRASLDGRDVCYYWKGTVYSFVPGEKDKPLFKFEGFNVGRLVKVEGGYDLLTREAAFFEDLKTGEIIEKWVNPWTKKELDVVQIWNDPVNQDFAFPEEVMPYLRHLLPSEDLGDMISFNLDLFLNYSSPLTREDYPLNSQSNTYEATELFQFLVNKDKLLDPTTKSVPVWITWTRVSPWMPFMEMGDKPGNLIFRCVGQKLDKGYEGLPLHIKKYVSLKNPQYHKSPDEYSEPNETSWTYFKKIAEAKKKAEQNKEK